MSLDRTRADSQETLRVGAMGVRFLVEAADSNGSVSVFECFVPADSRMPAPHSHDAFEETIYGLEGATSWAVDGRAVEIGVGDAFCIQFQRGIPIEIVSDDISAGDGWNVQQFARRFGQVLIRHRSVRCTEIHGLR